MRDEHADAIGGLEPQRDYDPLQGAYVGGYHVKPDARLVPDSIEIEWTEDADAATTTPVLPGLLTAGNFCTAS